MITRRASPCLRHLKNLPTRQHAFPTGRVQRRFVGSSNAPLPPTAVQSASAPVAAITTELDKLSQRIEIDANDVQIIKTPSEFYETVRSKILSAQHRIYLATLYVGAAEHDLISTLRTALKRNPNLKVSILTDALRGTRESPNPSCASLLVPLVEDFGVDRVDFRVFHTPNLTGLRKAVLPKRVNEGWGLQHMKLYGFDDEVIISGANLSADYFTNRQDRYHLFKSQKVTDYFAEVYHRVSLLSYQVLPSTTEGSGGFSMEWPTSNSQPAPLEHPKGYVEAATKLLGPLIENTPPQQDLAQRSDTCIYPLLQLTPLLNPDTSNELPAMTRILGLLSSPPFHRSRWTFTAGYFNMTPAIRSLLLDSSKHGASGTVIAASPWANGFFESKGVSGMLPSAYTYLARAFLRGAHNAGLGDRIKVKEWRRGTVNQPGGWSYHAKGIWITLPGECNPSVSLVGSSNYTKRSYALDLEANTMIVTRNPDLQKRLGEEEKWLQDYAAEMTRDDYAKNERRVGLHVRIAMLIVTLLGGAL